MTEEIEKIKESYNSLSSEDSLSPEVSDAEILEKIEKLLESNISDSEKDELICLKKTIKKWIAYIGYAIPLIALGDTTLYEQRMEERKRKMPLDKQKKES